MKSAVLHFLVVGWWRKKTTRWHSAHNRSVNECVIFCLVDVWFVHDLCHLPTKNWRCNTCICQAVSQIDSGMTCKISGNTRLTESYFFLTEQWNLMMKSKNEQRIVWCEEKVFRINFKPRLFIFFHSMLFLPSIHSITAEDPKKSFYYGRVMFKSWR